MRAPFELLIQHPQAKSIGRGSLNLDKAGDAQFFGGDNGDGPPLASMTRVRVEHAAAHGILLSGVEHLSAGVGGKPKVQLQEWWLRYTNNDPA